MNRYSWKTTLAGILAIVGTLSGVILKLLNGEPPLNEGDIALVLAALAAGSGLLASRDNDKTSKEVGATQFAAERDRVERNK